MHERKEWIRLVQPPSLGEQVWKGLRATAEAVGWLVLVACAYIAAEWVTR